MNRGDLVEIRNPFVNERGERYDVRVETGIFIGCERDQFGAEKIYDILVADGIRKFLASCWDVRTVNEAG